MKRITGILILVSVMMMLTACGGLYSAGSLQNTTINLEKTGSKKLSYATQYGVDYYGDYTLLTIGDSEKYLLVPEDKEIPEKLGSGITVVKKPIDKVYLAATSAMDLINMIGAIDNIALSGTKMDDWYVEAAKEKMADGSIAFAGKYSAPDYERMLDAGCNLAIESTMIYHNPEVKEKLESFNIPVLVEHSSYENEPLGRLEWIKLYGVLFDREKEADEYFENAVDKLQSLQEEKESGLSIAYFHVNSNGTVTVRKPGDYISAMIGLAGGKYILSDMKNAGDNALSTMNMQMEDFYKHAGAADIIIYDSAITGEIDSISDLIGKDKIFADFKAVKDKQVYCTNADFFQKTTGMSDFVEDLHNVVYGTGGKLIYLKKCQ